MEKIVLRPYQQIASEKTAAWLEDKKSVGKSGLVVLPVAAGKSILIANAVKKATELGYGVIVLQPSIELLKQNYHKFLAVGGKATVCSASSKLREISEVTYATLGSVKNNIKDFKAITNKWIFVIDEAHFSFSANKNSVYDKFKKELKPIKVIGYTATPFILKSKGMGLPTSLYIMTQTYPRTFTEFIHVEQVQTMVQGNYWAKLNFVEYDFNSSLLKLNTSGTDYTEESIALANSELGVNKSIYRDIKKLVLENKNNQLLVFVESVDIANKMQSVVCKFCKSGVVSGETKTAERKEIIEGFLNNDVRVIINYGVLTTGFDAPNMTHVLIGRPTNSFSLFYQIQGRVVRLHPDNTEATIIDYCGNFTRFGKINDIKIVNYPNFGMVATSNDKVLTGVPIGSGITTVDLLEYGKDRLRDAGLVGVKDVPKIPFGEYKGVKINDNRVPLKYLEWMITNCDLYRYPEFAKITKQYIHKHLGIKS